ncbi:hypothetical protein QZH41_002803 [Actinostola sp. cb2023]|nr:hypothetical protein QZH41_002803 [Actinostola sp. cb2023]
MSKTSWGFPKGKVNKDEDEFECAIREVCEETGFDMRNYADPENYIEHKIHDHPDIQWFEIEYLPTHKKDTTCTEYLNCNPSAFFMVIPFVKYYQYHHQHQHHHHIVITIIITTSTSFIITTNTSTPSIVIIIITIIITIIVIITTTITSPPPL